MKTSLCIKNFVRVFILYFLLFSSKQTRCQTTNISGVINDYQPVISFDSTGCKARLAVLTATAFSVGDSVLLIQMKGANFDSTNSFAFGSIVNLSGAGNYEVAAISSITSNTIMLNGKLVKRYLTGGRLQLVRIPCYVNANITGSLTCLPWDGQMGGVLIFSAQNSLTFNADIDVVGRGFRGGTITLNPDGFCGVGSSDYYYDVNAPGTSWGVGGAEKGEGIGSASTTKLGGKGHLVNGGGGGNKHNAGGGGGSNYTSGGKGGDEYIVCNFSNGGIGGLALSPSYTNNVIFAGGGGGRGDDNNGVGSAGENGGGIVIVTASSITGNNYLVNASGNTVTVVGGSVADGAGGGGGGGAVFINATTISNSFRVIANGGSGGNQAATACVGPGGGGGTGTILTNLASLAGVNYTLVPGPAGTFINGACAPANFGALAGSTNTVGPLTSRNLVHTPNAITNTATAITVSVCSGLPLTLTTSVVADNYSWNGPLFTSTSQNTLIAVTSTLDTGTYTLTASSLNGCVTIVTRTVTVNPTPTVSLPNFSVCSGTAINIVPVEAFASTYNWNGPNSFSSTLPTVSIPVSSPPMAGNYNLTVTSVAGCTASATGSIGVAVVSGITVSINSPACIGGTLYLTTGGGSGGLSYLWTGPSSYSSPLQNPTITPVSLSDSGTYTLVASVNGCSSTPITATIAVEAPPVITAASVSVCSGHTVSLGASAPTGVNYTWDGPGGFTATNSTFSFAAADASLVGVYNVTVTSALGCTNTGVANLSVTTTPTILLSSDQPVCAGGVLNFTATGGTSYQLLGPNGFSSASANPSITNVSLAAAGNYTLTGAANSCSAIAITSVVIKTKPIATIGTLTPVCAPRNFQLTAGGGVTYTWTGPGGFTSTQQNPLVSPSSLSSAGVYTVIVEGINSCQTTATTAISVITTPTVSAAGTTVCVGQPATLMSSGAISYTWTGPGNYSSTAPNAFIPVANNNSAGTYSLFVITVNTCTVSATVNLDLHPVPAPTITAPPMACINSTIFLLGSGGNSYLWKGPGSFSSSVQNPTLIPINITFDGTYTLTVLSAQGCSANTTAKINLYPLPSGKLSGRIEGCAPFCSDFQYKSQGLSTIISTTWITTTQYSTGLVFNDCFKLPGDFIITGMIEDTLGCKSSNSFSVHVRPKPEANYEYLPLKPAENIDYVIFRSTSTGDKIDTWSWYIDNNYNNVGSGQSFAHFFESAGIYPIVHTVRNAWGCWDTLIKAVEIISDFNIFVPEAFTPNGDGKNEIFQPKGTGIDSYQLTIFDRWGQKIFQTNVFEEGWDGVYKGVPCKSDVYVWEINAVRINGKKKDLRGQVLLCR